MAISLKTVLVFPEGIKTKCGYVLIIGSKARAKPASLSLDKKLTAYHVISFVNWKWKAKTRLSGNQAAQTQNQNLAPNTNARPSKPDATLASGNRLAPTLIKCFNYQKTGHYSQNCSNLENKRPWGLENKKSQ